MANDEFLINWVVSGEQDKGVIQRYLRRILEKYGYFSCFFVSEKTSNYYYYDGILKQISPYDPHDVWYYNFRDSDKEFILDVDTDEATQGTVTIFINYRLEDQKGDFLGVTGIGIKMVSIADTLASYQDRFGQAVYMIDTNGLIQVHTNPDFVEKVNIKELPGIGALAEQILVNKTGTNIYDFKSGNHDLVISTRYFPDFDWFLIVEQDHTDSLSTARMNLIINIAIGIMVTFLVILLVGITVNVFHNRLEELAVKDDLTGLFNRHKFEELFNRENDLAKRFGYVLSLLFLDIDDFKSINDKFGHQAGDRYLQKVAGVLQENIREIDVVARWGGEEFLILLHRPIDAQALQVAERLRAAVANIHLTTGKDTINRTISIGLATSSGGNLTMQELINQADQAMFQAKQTGKNRVITFTPPSD
jgi:diguanylate cyclase (GGDEF)-like protein